MTKRPILPFILLLFLICFMPVICTRMIMGFSPTVWASGYRTFYIPVICLIVIAIMIIDENKSDGTEIRPEESEV